MKRNASLANNASAVCFALSSLSLLLIPFLDLGSGLPKAAFWQGSCCRSPLREGKGKRKRRTAAKRGGC